MGWPERRALIAEIEKARGSRVVCYITSDRPNADAQIHKDVLPLLFEHLVAIGDGKDKHIDLLLHTSGGDTLAAFGIAQQIREYASRFGVLVPLKCHSAGTLISLAADEIVMTRGGTLSPIDPSIVGALNPAVEMAPGQRQLIPLSVETVAGFKDLVTEDWKIKGEEALTVAFRVLAEKVHPLALGDVYRARQQIEDLARKLLSSHREDEEAVKHIVKVLTRGLGSHDYPISRKDARGLFGPQVTIPDASLEAKMWDLFKNFSDEMMLREPFEPLIAISSARHKKQPIPVQAKAILAIVETTEWRDVAERNMLLSDVMHPMGRVAQVEVVDAGWKREIWTQGKGD